MKVIKFFLQKNMKFLKIGMLAIFLLGCSGEKQPHLDIILNIDGKKIVNESGSGENVQAINLKHKDLLEYIDLACEDRKSVVSLREYLVSQYQMKESANFIRDFKVPANKEVAKDREEGLVVTLDLKSFSCNRLQEG
jgi:hypothetical protein